MAIEQNNNLESILSKAVVVSGKYLKDSILEKVELFTNPKKIYHDMLELGKKEGPAFMAYAIAVEVVEDGVLPIILAYTGNEEYIPIVLIGHSEPIMYPLYFAIRSVYRKLKR